MSMLLCNLCLWNTTSHSASCLNCSSCGIANELNYETLVDHACSLELAMVAPLASLSYYRCHRCHVGWLQTQSIASSCCRRHQILVMRIPCSVQQMQVPPHMAQELLAQHNWEVFFVNEAGTGHVITEKKTLHHLPLPSMSHGSIASIVPHGPPLPSASIWISCVFV